ncbi:hypothetical protein BMS3Bbin06_01990 [bacterium BMS3Bbin06]|nr:hypothetical protein BMS3Abin08_01666 [bacterium BMS3Abin08]GBE35449.1 hypothetical protein BMS3Bbin06_01990 [bacterium BMS3Bbin06]HDO35199.1 YicC family protein [Nitrospirota bacterium]HDY71434.1 YicC family protein [Nitrospirota bacterium]
MDNKIQSMTGFGSSEARGFRIEARSVNHRFLDLHFRMPAFLGPYEMNLRRIVKENFTRGRIDVKISLTSDADVTLKINHGFASKILNSLAGLQEELQLKDGPSLNHLFWFKDVVFEEEPAYRPDDLFSTFSEAVQRLADMRCREGEHLKEEILKTLGEMEGHLDRIKEFSGEFYTRAFDKMKEQIGALLKEHIDENRLIQEAALLAERADISEEIARIESHSAQMKKIIAGGATIGRKIDFLLQELLREINTIGSKNSDYKVSEVVVLMKSEVEKMKEQIQNIQ